MKNDEFFEAAVAAVRDEPIDAKACEAARERVLARLAEVNDATSSLNKASNAGQDDHRILGCDGFLALLPAYDAGALAEPKRLLVEDHTRECLGCRKALAELRRGEVRTTGTNAVPRSARIAPRGRGWMALAAALGGIAILSGTLLFRAGAFRASPVAVVQAIDGELTVVNDSDSRAAVAGESFGGASAVRTGGGSGAIVVLADGSRVELAERSELALGKRWDGTVLKLARGRLIVEAAEQRRGHLYVETSDCQVSVVGTIFSVNAGTKGSRVSVIDGEVHVRQGVERAVLRPGDQLATGRRLRAVPVAQEIAWSRNASDYRERLAALKSLGRELDQTLVALGARSSTRLLDLVPGGTTVYVALPNLSQSLGSAWDLVVQRAAENPALAGWWNEQFADGGDAEISRAVDEIERFGAELGAEIAVAVQVANAPDTTDHPQVTLLAEVVDPVRFSTALDAEIERLNDLARSEGETGANRLQIRRVLEPATASASENELLVWLAGDILVATSSPAGLLAVADAIPSGTGAFVGTPLHGRLARVYGEGTDWLLGVDLASVIGQTRQASAVEGEGDSGSGEVVLDRLGLAEVENLVLDRSDGDGVEAGQNRAVLAFAGDRHGLASWLAAPAPLGALEFVSPAAHLAVAGILKEPRAIFDDLLALATAGEHPADEDGTTVESRIAEIESRLGISFRQDLAASLGGDFAFAFDGPWLPEPSWKIVLEVVDAGRLHATIQALVEAWNREAVEEGKPTIRWSQESVGGERIFSLALDGEGTAGSGRVIAHMLLSDGYLLVGPSRALLLEAVSQHDSGIQLAGSTAFLSLLPTDGRAHVSALVWQNLGASVGMLGQFLNQSATDGESGGEGSSADLSAILGEGGPGLAVVYADGREISFVSQGLKGPLGLSFESLLSIGDLFAHEGEDADPVDEESTSLEDSTAIEVRTETRVRRIA